MATPCYVLGLFDTGLAVVRALGRAGLPVVGLDVRADEPGFRSRYGTHHVCPDPRLDPGALLDCLLAHARTAAVPPILFPTSDAFVAFVSEYRDALTPHFQHALPCREAVSAALDKGTQYTLAARAGVPVPRTHAPQTLDDVRALAPALDYPVVIKPNVGYTWRAAYRADKALRVDDAPSLIALFRDIVAAGQPALVQSLVTGGNTNHCKVCAYFDAAGEPLAMICMRKIRQFPVDFGVGTLMETVDEPELRALGLRLFQALGWRGPGSIEFKRDARDGAWKLIELNPRLWQQNGLAAAAGMNFPLLQYLDLTGQPRAVPSYRLGIRWIDEFRDPRSAWAHRADGHVTITGWARSLRRVRTSALWATDDPRPFLAAMHHHLRRSWRHGRVRPAGLAESH